jgi:N-acetylmuramidase
LEETQAAENREGARVETKPFEQIIAEPVGLDGLNDGADVVTVQWLFNLISGSTVFPEDGVCTDALVDRIRGFQYDLGFKIPDGLVQPAKRTLRALVQEAAYGLLAFTLTKRGVSVKPAAAKAKRSTRPQKAHPAKPKTTAPGKPPAQPPEKKAPAAGTAPAPAKTAPAPAKTAPAPAPAPPATAPAPAKTAPAPAKTALAGAAKLTDADFAAAADALKPGVQVAMIRAFAEVESGGKSGFGPSGLPIIAFEGHLFRKYSKGKFDQSNPLLSYPYKQKAGPEWQQNNKNQQTAWKTLNAALALDQEAALLSCSWGMFQVMGFNFAACGYKSVDDFVTGMKAGERGQLDAFVGFIKSTAGLRQALADKNFAKCASSYNGKDYGNYDKLIEKHFIKNGGQ